MTQQMSRRGMALALGAALLAAACSKKPETAPAPAAVPPGPTAGIAAATGGDSAARAAARDSVARAVAARDAAREAALRKVRDDSIAAVRALASKTAAELKQVLLATVYFDYDKSDVRDDTRAALELKLPILGANPSLRVRIQGHTDERGSDEYNLALGQRRAAALKRYFTDRGVAEARIDVVSFGRERPAAPGEDDAARARNRRGEFEILAGGEGLQGPR
ncbi:MAG: OmpA family protein [Gemmatimonadetes bacterium]|nr:OmpA family protein [Gemmatimonadota bacterium]